MRLNETALQREKLHEQQQSLAQLNRIKEGVQLLLDALERNMERHPECTPEEARLLERQLADTSKVLRDVLDLERHPQQPANDWIPKLNRIEENLFKYTDINPTQPFDIEADAMTNLERLFQEENPLKKPEFWQWPPATEADLGGLPPCPSRRPHPRRARPLQGPSPNAHLGRWRT